MAPAVLQAATLAPTTALSVRAPFFWHSAALSSKRSDRGPLLGLKFPTLGSVRVGRLHVEANASGNKANMGSDEGSGAAVAKPSLLARLGQSFNSQGIAAVAGVVLKNPSLAMPHVSVPDIRWVDWRALRQAGFKGVVFDKDNTLTHPYTMHLHPPLLPSLHACQAAFGPDALAILSNSAGLQQYDPEGQHARAMEVALGVRVVRHAAKKPGGGTAALQSHFNCDPHFLVLVGDRCLTDIVYGNRNFLLTILTAPLSPHTDPPIIRHVRRMEDSLMNLYKSRGVKPPSHPLLPPASAAGYPFILPPACW